LHLDTLILTNFKNYATQRLTFSERLNCFVGLNGMGKTNLLDAIYYLCLCKSNFLSSDTDVVLRGGDFMRLEGDFIKNGRLEKIVAKVQPRKKKIIERNGLAYAGLSEHIGFLPVVFFAPDDTLLAKEGSEERRRFLDMALSQFDNQYLTNLIFYNKILEQRNAHLKKQGNTEGGYDEKLITIYDTQLLTPARYIHEKRKNFTVLLTPIFNDLYKKIADAHEEVGIQYESQLLTFDLKDLMLKNREKDRILQRTTSGIHRDDLIFTMDEKPLKRFGSQGQLKSYILALKLAQHEILAQSVLAETGVKKDMPILLLDDIFDKLDEKRVENLLQLLVNQPYGQIFMTDTHKERIENIVKNVAVPFKIFDVENGKVK
jgi:DNA replication and repair protein RecF